MSSIKIGTITDTRADAVRRIRDRGPAAWSAGTTRQAARRMYQAMVEEGLCAEPAYTITDAGRRVLEAYDLEVGARRQRREPLRMLGVSRHA